MARLLKKQKTAYEIRLSLVGSEMCIRDSLYAFPFSLMYLLFRTDFYIFRNFVFFVFLVVQYRRSVIYKIKRLDTNTRDFGYTVYQLRIWGEGASRREEGLIAFFL